MVSSNMLDFEHILNSEREVIVPTFEGDIETRMTERTGVGLFAKKDIPAGSVVFAEKVLCLTDELIGDSDSEATTNKIINKAASEMGTEWYSKFLRLDAYDEANAEYKKLWALYLWAKHFLPAKSNGRQSGILGLNLAWMNHACWPNCTLTLPKKYPDQDGEGEPVVTCSVLKATQDIKEGEELTFCYFDIRGSYKSRRALCFEHFHAPCACQYCDKPDQRIESTFLALDEANIMLKSPAVIDRRPALAYYTAYYLSDQDFIGQHNNVQVAYIFAQCAVVAGFHSDVARAICFLDEAIKKISALRPTEDPFRRLYTHWRNNVDKMPGFGSTTCGLSTEEQKLDYERDRTILFMLHARSKEYLPVGRCLRITEDMHAQIGDIGLGVCDILVVPKDFDATRRDHDWKKLAQKYRRCDYRVSKHKRDIVEDKTGKVFDEMAKREETPSEHTVRPYSPSVDVEEGLNQSIKKMARLMEEDHTSQTADESEDATGGEESDTGSTATVAPAEAIKKAKKKGRK